MMGMAYKTLFSRREGSDWTSEISEGLWRKIYVDLCRMLGKGAYSRSRKGKSYECEKTVYEP
jgi:hypothetical protein